MIGEGDGVVVWGQLVCGGWGGGWGAVGVVIMTMQ